MALGCIVSTGLLSKMGEINLMIFGAFLNVPFMASFLLSSLKIDYPEFDTFLYKPFYVYLVILVCSFLRGFGEAILFVASGKYISDCANDSNKGFYFGYFWGWFMMSEIFGNLVAAIVLGRMS